MPRDWGTMVESARATFKTMEQGSWWLLVGTCMALTPIARSTPWLPPAAAGFAMLGAIFQLGWCIRVHIPTLNLLWDRRPLAELERGLVGGMERGDAEVKRALLKGMSPIRLFLPNSMSLLLAAVILRPFVQGTSHAP